MNKDSKKIKRTSITIFVLGGILLLAAAVLGVLVILSFYYNLNEYSEAWIQELGPFEQWTQAEFYKAYCWWYQNNATFSSEYTNIVFFSWLSAACTAVGSLVYIIGCSINLSSTVSLYNDITLVSRAKVGGRLNGLYGISSLQILFSAVAIGAGIFVGTVLWNLGNSTDVRNIEVEWVTPLYSLIPLVIFVLQIPGIACGVSQNSQIKKLY